jgi:hypothetical protein
LFLLVMLGALGGPSSSSPTPFFIVYPPLSARASGSRERIP